METIRKISIEKIKSVGRNVVLRLPNGEEVAVNYRNLCELASQRESNFVMIFRSVEDLKEKFKGFCELVCRGGNALIPVSSAGKGSSGKSRKIKVAGVLHSTETADGFVSERREHTLTLPASLLVEVDGQFYAPQWILKKTVHERVLNGKGWPSSFAGGMWPGREKLWGEIFAPLAKDIEREIEELERQRAAQAELQKEEAARRQARQKLEEEAQIKAKEEKRREEEKAAIKKKKRMDSLEKIQVESVEWDEWVKFKNDLGYKSHKKVTTSEENCTLYFSGQRVYILLEDGTEIIKARNNVRWGDAIKGTGEEN